MANRIEDYAVIGNCETLALVARDGSIDWLCLPRFDSDACFAALLGQPDNGHWALRPADHVEAKSRRAYREGSLLLETVWTCDHGQVRVLDFMPPRGRAPDVIRIVVGERGEVPMRTNLCV